MPLTLRPYQTDLLARARAAMRQGTRRLLLTAPCGAGKTVLVAAMLQGVIARQKRAWFVVHRRELLRQSVTTLTESADLSVGIVSAGVRLDPREQVQVCGIQSLVRRMGRLSDPDVIVWDECHHVASKSWAAIAARYDKAVHVGLTATPQRLDGKGLGAWFDDLLLGPSVTDLIAQGYLAPYRLIAPPSNLDLSHVHTVAGDYNKHEAAAAMTSSTVMGDALREYQARASGLRALLFLWSIDASQQTVLRFREAGIAAAHVDGTTPERERDRLMADFRSGTLKVLSNVDLVSEGFDVPAIDAVFLLRPTESLGLYLQQVGRALRPYPGKSHALIFDHVANYTRHGLPDDARAWSLDGKAAKATNALKVKTCPTCYAIISAFDSECEYCGHVFAREGPRELEQLDGDLVEVDVIALRLARAREEGSCRTLEDLQALGRARGYKPGWATFLWQARLGKQRQRERLRA